MYWPDVIDLKSFYASPLGQVLCRSLRRKIRDFWPDENGARIIGVGYAAPFLTSYLDEARLTACLMPMGQGVTHWPSPAYSLKQNLSAMVEETSLPLPDESVTRALVAHALENTEHGWQLLSEIWRVLEPGGRVICIVPNRSGLLAHVETTPFGQGRPFSLGQLKAILRDSQLTPSRHAMAGFFAPFHSKMALRISRVCEPLFSVLLRPLGGLIVMEAEKQVYALRAKGKPERKYKPILVPAAPQPALTLNRSTSYGQQ
ncbi:MAG: methyltransferase domain-containing protein [Alphaproteobacteria bacterium]|nr:methyltransferase domain-containing protein [Alphaproteobacteria bacterium]